MTQPIVEGQLLAEKYRVERVLGQGGMGVVVAATHVQLEQRVALKFLLDDAASNSEAVGRFLREARASVKLKSEHVARVLDVGTLDTGVPFLVMEYLEGHDLHTELENQGQLPVEHAVHCVLQACEAIAEAHSLGIIHRDLKPANLFMASRADGALSIKVLDFGISKVTAEAASYQMTRTSSVLGTPFYMSPEQLRASRSVDARSDIWALGVILYELLTGQVAFPEQSLPELCAAILTDPVRPPRELCPTIPFELDLAICKCLEKDAADRYQSVEELGRALAQFHPDGDAFAARISRIVRRDPPGAPRASQPRKVSAEASTLGFDEIADVPRASPVPEPAPLDPVQQPAPAAPLSPASSAAPPSRQPSRLATLGGAASLAAFLVLLALGAARSRGATAAGEAQPSPAQSLAAASPSPASSALSLQTSPGSNPISPVASAAAAAPIAPAAPSTSPITNSSSRAAAMSSPPPSSNHPKPREKSRPQAADPPPAILDFGGRR